MDKIWIDMYEAAKAVQNERKILNYGLCGSFGESLL